MQFLIMAVIFMSPLVNAMSYTPRDLLDDAAYTRQLDYSWKDARIDGDQIRAQREANRLAAEQLKAKREFARKEREIGRPLNQSEKNYYLQYGGYPASQNERLRNMSWDDLSKQENSPSYVERRRRVNEARNRTPLENAIRRWFTPIKNQIPEKYLK
jgi:hypothetical protein